MDRPVARRDVFIFIAEYASEADACADYEIVKDLHGWGALDAFDAAVVTRDTDGTLSVEMLGLPIRRGAWSGAAAGAVVGVLFPPSLLVGGAIGAGAGALVGHFRRGLSRADVGALSRIVGAGSAAVVVVTERSAAHLLERNLLRARATIERGIAPQHELVGALGRA